MNYGITKVLYHYRYMSQRCVSMGVGSRATFSEPCPASQCGARHPTM
eukprot:COSAG03_NODE_16092_length_412_cov_0.610224_1_plen_46_part_10